MGNMDIYYNTCSDKVLKGNVDQNQKSEVCFQQISRFSIKLAPPPIGRPWRFLIYKCVPDLERIPDNKNAFLILTFFFKQFPFVPCSFFQ